ncbi:hypothetical protein V493_05934 [Pseudogymnoascus sp. VKM F-4281 (FW-2241)]|nr:hypothetical protein V493_05934 [Pseudogymnoascus sp. VKM F-4281 (FW-2241)]
MSGGPYYTNPLQGEDYSYAVGDSSHVGFYDSASGGSSIGSPDISQDPKECNNLTQYDQFQPYLYQYETPEMYHASHLAATIELKIEDLYDDVDLRTKRATSTTGANPATSQIHSRRRAQNRASQRAFRNRKEKHVKEVEARLQELEGKYRDLSESYESLQTEYVVAKQELGKLTAEERSQSQSESPKATYVMPESGLDGGPGEDLSNILFGNEVFSFEAVSMTTGAI